jgi:RecA-family ATPase
MSQEIWLIDPISGEEICVPYSELEYDVKQQLFAKPLGGFIFPAGVFVKKPLPQAPFYVKDWLPKRGKALLYAPAKSGKSTICLQIANCIGSGEPFFGQATTKGKVLYIQLELGEEVLQKRMMQTGQEYENVWVGTTFTMKLDTPPLRGPNGTELRGGQKLLVDAMEAVQPNVLIIDPWYKAITGDENESHDVMPILDFLDSVIEGFNCSILLIHHAGKDISKRGRGSSVLEDWVDSYLQLKKISKDPEQLKVQLKPIFLRHAASEEPIEAVLTDKLEFEVLGAEKTVKQQVAEFVLAKGKALKQLAEEGVIKKAEYGHYSKV